MPSINKIKYTDATLRQLTKSQFKSDFPHSLLGKTVDEVVLSTKMEDRLQKYKSYDRYGRVTIVGKAKRQQDLMELNLPETATVKEYLAKWQEAFSLHLVKMCKKITKTNKNLIENANARRFEKK